MQVGDDTILFWDFAEDTYYDYEDQGDSGDGFTDLSGVYGQIYPHSSGYLRIYRGANANAGVYGVGFHGGSNYYLENTTVMPAAILNAMHDGDITFECYLRQYRYNNYIGWLGMAGGVDAVEGNNHQLCIYVGASGVLYAFWEYAAAGTDVLITSTKSLTAGSDHHLVFQRRDDGATCSARFIVDDSAESWQTGKEFPTGGGNGGIVFGAATSQLSGTPNYPAEGVLGDCRLLKKLITAEEISANYALMATTAQLPYDDTDSLFHYQFGSEMEPSLIDQSVNRLHLTRSNFGATGHEPLDGVDQRARVDFWRSGGRAIALHGGQWGEVEDQEVAGRDATFADLLYYDTETPDYSVNLLLVGRGEETWPPVGPLLDFGPGENRALYVQINTTRTVRIYWEYGAGTNMDWTTSSAVFSVDEAKGMVFLGIKVVPQVTAGKVKIEVWVNGTLRETSLEQFAATERTSSHNPPNLRFGGASTDEVWVQQIKIDAPALSAAEMLAAYETLPEGPAAGGDTTPPTISNMTPTPGVFPGTRAQAKITPIEFDVTDIDPGLKIVVLTLKYAGTNSTLVVHNGTEFLYPFDSSESARTVITDGFHFKVLPRKGWTANIDDLQVYALDSHGNLEGGLP